MVKTQTKVSAAVYMALAVAAVGAAVAVGSSMISGGLPATVANPVPSLTVAKYNTLPAAVIPLTNNAKIASFVFTVTGQPAIISQIKIKINFNSNNTLPVNAVFNNFRLVNQNNGVLFGSGIFDTNNNSVTFTGSSSFRLGSNRVIVMADVSPNVKLAAGDAVSISVLNPSTDVIATGLISKSRVAVSPTSVVAGDAMPLSFTSLKVSLDALSQSAKSVFEGMANVPVAHVILDTTGSNSNIVVKGLKLFLASNKLSLWLNSIAPGHNIGNFRLLNSGQVISSLSEPEYIHMGNSGILNLNFNQPISVAPNQQKKLDLFADIGVKIVGVPSFSGELVGFMIQLEANTIGKNSVIANDLNGQALGSLIINYNYGTGNFIQVFLQSATPASAN